MAKVSTIRRLDKDQLHRRWSGLDPLPADSSNVHSYAYDEQSRVLFVAFLKKPGGGRGSVYAYDCDLLPEMHAAGSKGEFVHHVLKARNIDYLQID